MPLPINEHSEESGSLESGGQQWWEWGTNDSIERAKEALAGNAGETDDEDEHACLVSDVIDSKYNGFYSCPNEYQKIYKPTS